MTEGVKVDELFDLRWKAQQDRIHDVRQVARQCLHVVARFFLQSRGNPDEIC